MISALTTIAIYWLALNLAFVAIALIQVLRRKRLIPTNLHRPIDGCSFCWRSEI
jgi:hypothetical protein